MTPARLRCAVHSTTMRTTWAIWERAPIPPSDTQCDSSMAYCVTYTQYLLGADANLTRPLDYMFKWPSISHTISSTQAPVRSFNRVQRPHRGDQRLLSALKSCFYSVSVSVQDLGAVASTMPVWFTRTNNLMEASLVLSAVILFPLNPDTLSGPRAGLAKSEKGFMHQGKEGRATQHALAHITDESMRTEVPASIILSFHQQEVCNLRKPF
ncbi:hypothetical protein V8E53_007125 [Lactarius tabidus]